ncbi:MAG: GFA family protein [Parafilimonas terrae]|nr:GFA family protein [Parafilimonas terrae]
MIHVTAGGGCNCGAVRLECRGEPIRVGLCHCGTCRKETGGPFGAFVVWPAPAVTVTGRTASWTADGGGTRHFCPTCGSPLFWAEAGSDEIEVRLGCLDEMPSGLVPVYELWTVRREHWLPPLEGAEQHTGNRS